MSTRAKLSGLWAVLVLLYAYADVLSLFRPGQLEDVIVPALMVFLTLAMPATVGRWTNVVLGVVYTAVSAGNLVGETWAYYLLFGALEVVIAVAIVRYAWKWQPHG